MYSLLFVVLCPNSCAYRCQSEIHDFQSVSQLLFVVHSFGAQLQIQCP